MPNITSSQGTSVRYFTRSPYVDFCVDLSCMDYTRSFGFSIARVHTARVKSV
ncbi:Bgt-51449 [Blumeria graminis f. sp. tritici]|uniref:Bgt-51449 n=1 Tax=Blumeria graminis f. sp. tritici TaxID=62690 RepID=A0A9X9L9W3_BLUGR|nr:Bgt-51449 [Blumeria graminis f. sp. tritici]